MIRVNCFAISLDGYGAGPRQELKNPLGVGGEGLHRWFVPTRTFQTMVLGKQQGTTGIDDDYARRGMENLGAWILGRNMFGPVRGEWPDENWKGWWVHRDGGRHDLSFRHRGHRGSASARQGSCRLKRYTEWWRRLDRAPVPARRPGG